MEQLRLDDLRTGDRIRITTTNCKYEILVVASEAQLGEICGGHVDFPLHVTLTGNPAHARYSNAAIDVGHEFEFATVIPSRRLREASVRCRIDRDHTAHASGLGPWRRCRLSPIAVDRGGQHPAMAQSSAIVSPD